MSMNPLPLIPVTALLLSTLGFAAEITPASTSPADATSTPDEQTVEVHFKNGDSERGVVVSKTTEQLVLRVTMVGKGTRITTERTYPMTQVAMIATVADEYRLRAANTPNNPPEQAELARWCFDHGLAAEARGHALKALDAEAVNRDAQDTLRRLGLMQLDGAWLDVDEWLAAKKLVRFEGLVTDADTKARLIKLATPRSVDANALAELKRQIETLTNLAAAAKERSATIDKSRTEADNAAATADSRQKAVDSAKKGVAAAAEAVKKASEAPPADRKQSQDQQKRDAANAATTLANAEAAKKKANDALSAAQKELSAVDPASAKARKARLDADTVKAKADAERVAKELPLAQAALPAKQAAANASAKAYADARAAITMPKDLPPAVVKFMADEAAAAAAKK